MYIVKNSSPETPQNQTVKTYLAKLEDHDAVEDEDVVEAIRGLRNNRGIGMDFWKPLDWKRLPTQGKKELAQSIRDAETAVSVPVQQLCTAMAVLPKPTPGERCIAPQGLWHVVWSAVRSTKVKHFDADIAPF